MALHSLELLLDPDSETWVRAEWEALARAGLPSQARHRGATNAPHITIASAAAIEPHAERCAVDVLAPLLPVRVDLAGVVLIGRGPYALARLLAPDAAVDTAVRLVRQQVDDPHSPGWLPHLTLARRLPPAQVGVAIAEIATGSDVPRDVLVTGLRRWDPDTRTVRLLAGT